MTTISSASVTATNTSRISGLASGMDIDTMVRDMMAAERFPLDKLQQNKQILEWQQEDYRALNTLLYDFRNNAFDTRLQGTFETKTASSSNATIAAVKASVSAIEGSYKITVNNLASGVSKGSNASLADEKDINGNILTLYKQFTEFGAGGRELASTDNISVNINGTTLKFDLDQDNINTVVSKINKADLGVKASYDTTLNRFFLTTTTTGSDSKVTITEDSANFFSNSSADSNDSILKLKIDQGESYQGQNASLQFNDAAGLESATNSITINGLNFNLKSEGSFTVTVSNDTDAVVDSIKEFVESYNKTISTLYSKVTEERNRNYLPLTDAQKKEMSDDEIEKWEAKASSGLLRNDNLLQTIISDLRRAISSTVNGVDGKYNSLADIGITTGAYKDNGKLSIDEDKLRAALADNAESVKQMFTNISDNKNEKGISAQLYDLTNKGIKYLSDKAGSSSSLSSIDESYIGKRLTEMDDKIEEWETKLEKIENRYYSQFTAMETLINQMNIQASWLAAQFSTS